MTEAEGVALVDHSEGRKETVDWPTYLIVFLLGVGLLFPWNAVVLAVDYFTALYPDPAPFLFMLSFYYTIPQPVLSLGMLWRGRSVPVQTRIWVSCAVMGVCMALMPVLAPKGAGWAIALILVIGAATAVYQPSLFGLASQFPGIYSQAQMTGQGLAGIVASLARIITKASLSSGASGASTDAFFGVAAFVLVLCMGGMWYLVRSEYAQRFMGAPGTKSGEGDEENEAPLLAASEDAENGASMVVPVLSEGGSASNASAAQGGWARVPVLFRQAMIPLSSIFLAFFVTFVVFPGVIDQIPFYGTMGHNDTLSGGEWWPILLLLEFNVFDTLGRSLSAFWHTSVNLTGIFAVARSVFVPMLVFLARTTPPTGGVLFSNDVSTLIVMALYSFSNGFVSSRALILAPTLVDVADHEIIGFLMGFFVQLGILSGALIGLAVSKA